MSARFRGRRRTSALPRAKALAPVARSAQIARGARAAAFAFAVSAGACGVPADDFHGVESRERTGAVPAALAPSDPVSLAVTEACTTASVKGLSTQLVEEMQCLRPGTFATLAGVPGLALGEAVFPFLQAPAVRAVADAQADRRATMAINSALRTLPQQYLLYRWYQLGRCNISLAAQPGRSNHESGLAVDIEDDSGWRPFMTAHDMKWLGASDPVHFDYVGPGAVDVAGLSVRAFQRLWNRNHPEDPIAEDGDYGTQTADRLARAPVGGFEKGAECNEAPSPPATDAGEPTDAGPAASGERLDSSADDGCSCTSAGARSGAGPCGAAMAVLSAVSAALRRRSRGRVERVEWGRVDAN